MNEINMKTVIDASKFSAKQLQIAIIHAVDLMSRSGATEIRIDRYAQPDGSYQVRIQGDRKLTAAEQN